MILSLDHLHVVRAGRIVLEDASLRLERGTIYGLLGPNGAGKSTTIAAALGQLPISRGEIRIFNRDPRMAGPELRAHVGVLTEQNGFPEWMSAQEYLAYFAALYRMKPVSAELQARLEIVGLDPRDPKPIATYSRGMKQRLGLARALLPNPHLLFLDEPTNGLDPRGRREVHDILLGLADAGTTILMTTHLLDDVERLCSHIGILFQGRTIVDGRMSELLAADRARQRFKLHLAMLPEPAQLHGAPIAIVARADHWLTVDIVSDAHPQDVWRELAFRGWSIVEVIDAGGGLEALYLAVTSEPQPIREAAE